MNQRPSKSEYTCLRITPLKIEREEHSSPYPRLGDESHHRRPEAEDYSEESVGEDEESNEESNDSTTEYISQREERRLYRQRRADDRVEFARQPPPQSNRAKRRQPQPQQQQQQLPQQRFALMDLASLYYINSGAPPVPVVSSTPNGAAVRAPIQTCDKSTATINEIATETDAAVFRGGFDEDFDHLGRIHTSDLP